MSLGIGLGITSIHGLPIIGKGELSKFDASANAGLFVYSPSWPLLGSAPGTVVNGKRFRLAGGGTYGTEYKGVGGVWVAQPSVTMVLLQSNGTDWCFIDCLTDDNGNPILIDGEPITQIPFDTQILLNEDGTIALNDDGTIAVGV